MTSSGGGTNPISVPPGQLQVGVDPIEREPSRGDLVRSRLEFQRTLLRRKPPRPTPIQVSSDGVIIDGHHAVRAAAEEGQMVDVLVTAFTAPGKGCSILDLDVR